MKCIDCQHATTNDQNGKRMTEYALIGLLRCTDHTINKALGSVSCAMYFSARYERDCESFTTRG
jgi:hypothetical protein